MNAKQPNTKMQIDHGTGQSFGFNNAFGRTARCLVRVRDSMCQHRSIFSASQHKERRSTTQRHNNAMAGFVLKSAGGRKRLYRLYNRISWTYIHRHHQLADCVRRTNVNEVGLICCVSTRANLTSKKLFSASHAGYFRCSCGAIGHQTTTNFLLPCACAPQRVQVLTTSSQWPSGVRVGRHLIVSRRTYSHSVLIAYSEWQNGHKRPNQTSIDCHSQYCTHV
jgi:hypothetical protein